VRPNDLPLRLGRFTVEVLEFDYLRLVERQMNF
jgi:hypothetical protein